MSKSNELYLEPLVENTEVLVFIAQYIDNTGDVGLYALENVPEELKKQMDYLMPKYRILAQDYDGLLKRFPQKQNLLRHYAFMCGDDVDRLSMSLLKHDVFRYLITVDKIIEGKLKSQIQNIGLLIDSENLVQIDDNFTLLPQGIQYKGALMFYNQFLRRHYTSHYTSMTSVLKQVLSEKGLKLYLNIDEFRLSSPDKYLDIIELDYHYGKPFTRGLLDDRKHVGALVHTRSVENEHLNMFFAMKRVDVTFNQHGTNMKSVQIEEIIPTYEDEVENVNRYSKTASSRFRINRHVHFEYNQDTKNVVHIDASVKIYPNAQYTKRFSDFGNSQKVDSMKRIKLFRIDGNIKYELFQDILVNYFYYNELVSEIFIENQAEVVLQ